MIKIKPLDPIDLLPHSSSSLQIFNQHSNNPGKKDSKTKQKQKSRSIVFVTKGD
jgi:hypothetical protein